MTPADPPLGTRTVASSRTETVTLMTPDMANFGGSVHGGHVLRLIDQIAYACAASYSGRYCVTCSVDRVEFRVPVRVGDLLALRAQVNYVGRSSMEVGVYAEARDLRSGEARHTNSCYVTMVALDEETRRPAPVPRLVCETDEDRRRHAEAARRRRRARIIEEVEAGEERLGRMIDAAREAVVVTDAEGAVQDSNPAARALLGLDEAALAGRSEAELHPAEARDRAAALRDEVRRVGFAEGSLPFLTAGGAVVELAVTAWLHPFPGRDLVQRVLRPVP